ncbi:MAG TPA: hypothetical protein DEH78_19830 [Solibacterales bacterium]|nr:hypothetical protein [Bryobacterales bacterium]
MKNGFRLFDTHTHIGNARHSGRSVSAGQMLLNMDRHGVDRSLAIPFPVVADYRAEHDLIGQAVKAHPDRLTGAACLDPYLPRAEFQAEVRRCREQHGFRALKLQPQYHGLNPFSPSSDFFFEAALEHGMAVVCHTGSGAPFALPSLLMMPARKYPDLTIVAAHCGGGIYVHEAIVAALFCPNLVLEVSSLAPHHVLEVLRHVPATRVMAGSDLMESVEAEMGKILTLDIGETDRRAILWDTPLRIFGE